MTETFLGIDIGTSAVKAVLVDTGQRLLASESRPMPTARPRPGWSEQDPELWWRTVVAVLADLRDKAGAPYRSVAAIGLSGQMHGAVLLGADDRPLRPAILWNDARATAECRDLEAAVPGFGRIAGVGAMPGLTAPKLLWLQRHEPDVFARIACVMLPKDYVRLQLTGEKLTDMSDAAGALFLDEAARTWSAPILAACGLGEHQMPALTESPAAAGRLTRAAAEVLGLDADRPGGIVVAGGAGDAAAGALGVGAVTGGDAFISLGTSAQLFVTTDSYRPAPETVVHAFAHAMPATWYQMGAMLNGASCVGFIARLLGADDVDALVARSADAYAGPQRLLFLPYLVGERTPHDDPDARGVLFGLDPATTQEAAVQAVLEGVAYSLAEARDCLAAAGTDLGHAAIIGGGARSPFWTRIIASVLGVPIVRYRGGETGPAFGAARLARMAATGEGAEVCTKPEVEAVVEPDPAFRDAYAEGLARYKRLYRALRPEFRA
ncbi:xylulokinase [Methylobrevis albus]|uniref:Xylulose kinase n=1 Tax=Methylobrevis albus TaxID=2793297 RepID=A0A931I2H5_9HYPH|nr:xylulokinase [Methylobrevis albus]MBH0238098.1 xylulokinase [Methylobrevis albus]